ncbi:MAG: hypothetical protein J5J06_17215 [Phycisphaerae bacterium]|nr:hypothetical protein [Phycisphaerae bacterium]
MLRSGLVAFFLLCGSLAVASGQTEPFDYRAAIEQLKAERPGVQVREEQGRVVALFGVALANGGSARESADQVAVQYAQLLGADPADLAPGSLVDNNRETVGVMFDPDTGSYKFTLAYYNQVRSGLPVYGRELRVLVRNEPGHPAVWARSNLRNLGGFNAAQRGPVADFASARAAVVSRFPQVDRFAEERAVIWAGPEEAASDPRVAVSFVAEGGNPAAGEYFKHRLVVDNATGEILLDEDLIVFENVLGSVTGNYTPGPKAAQCTNEVSAAFRYATVSIQGGASAFATPFGNFEIPNAGTSSVTVLSPIRGQYFQVINAAGITEELTQTVTPPGPASFVHNLPNTDELVLAQVNGYMNANDVRDFVLSVHPTYPVVSTQTNFTVRVNRNDFYCPGNAWYDGSALNFCRATSTYGNTSFASVSQHEYGHHLVEMAGSGQAEYGEGMSDCIAMLVADDPGLGYGFFFNDCNTPLRNADNNCQYSATSCSTCGSESHDCGNLLSGCVWDLRENLGQSQPLMGLAIVRNLTVNSILLHSGSGITPQIAIDFLTLDDDDANINNGSPHWSEICTAFGAHGIDCPPVQAIEFSYPQGIPSTIPPGAPYPLLVDVVPTNGSPVPGSGVLHWRNGTSGGFITASMTESSPNSYQGEIPAATCGEVLEFFVSAEASGFGPMYDPPNGESAPYARIVATGVDVEASFDFESAPGWAVSGTATDGQWTRGIPAGGGSRGDPPTDYDGSGQCYVTDNVAGNSDVDNGDTILTSPAFDLTGMGNPYVRYARWYSNTAGDNPQADVFDVQVSDDNGATWTLLERVGPTGIEAAGGWYFRMLPLAGLIDYTNSVRIRFIASDFGGGSVIEAGVDALEVFDLVCGAASPIAADWPDSAETNRYISFAPNNGTDAVNFQVELLSGPGTPGIVGWVDAPNAMGVSRLSASPPAPRVWSESVVHVGDCPIVPGSSYAVRSSYDGVLFSGDLVVNTTPIPADGRFWADVVGTFDGVAQEWLPPDGNVGGFDITAVVQGFQQGSASPPMTWADLHPEAPDGLVNGNDILQTVRAFAFEPYPFSVPSDCP